MRIGEQLQILKKNVPFLKLEIQSVQNQALARVVNASSVSAALDELAQLPYLTSYVEGARSSLLYRVMDNTNVDVQLVNQYNSTLQSVINIANLAAGALTMAAPLNMKMVS